MTKEELSQYIDLKSEVKLLEEKIKELQERETQYSNDVVTGSSPNFPYTEYPVKIYGLDNEYEEKIIKSINRKELRLKRLKLECEEKAEQVFEYINSQKDSRTRRVLTYAYIDRLTQKKIAKIMHIDRSVVSRIITSAITYKADE